jgi:hypothetical protein
MKTRERETSASRAPSIPSSGLRVISIRVAMIVVVLSGLEKSRSRVGGSASAGYRGYRGYFFHRCV